MRDHCDICGAALDDDSVVQEFPDGSVVSLCADCASGVGPDDEMEPEEDLDADDATVEWTGPHDDPTAPAPPQFEAEVFDSEEYEFSEPAPPVRPPAYEDEDDADAGTARAEAELAAWASAPSDEDEQESDFDEEYNEQETEEATLQLVAAIAEADMAEEDHYYHHEDSEESDSEDLYEEEPQIETEPETGMQPESEAQAELGAALEQLEEIAPAVETIDRSQEILTPISELLALQTEMQAALAKLSSTLEHFVSDMDLPVEKVPSADERVQQLEDELESTRERLRLAESLLPESALDAAAAMAAATATRDTELLASPRAAEAPSFGDIASPPPPPPPLPPLPASASVPAKTQDSHATGAVPPLDAKLTSGGAPVPPPLPGLAKAGAVAGTAAAGVMAAKAAGAAAAGTGAAAVAKALTPPPIGSPKPSQPAPPPALPAKPPAKSADSAPESGVGAQDLPGEPISGLSGLETTQTAKTASAKPAAQRPATQRPPVSRAPAQDGTAVDDMGMAPASDFISPPAPPAVPPSPTATAVAGAAAAMHKLLRGRKGHHEPQPEPEPEHEPEPVEVPGLAFKINEVQAAQRYFNQSEYVKKLSEISRNIGKPRANVSRTSPGMTEAAITVFWDIVWYQYIIDLRSDLPADQQRVVLAQEGMDLGELEPRFTEKNATINDDGRIDASELEVRLLSDPEAIIDNMEVSTPETRLAEDATEEIWDQQSAPEFRWD